MECFFYENLSFKDSEIVISGEEFKHLKALRIQKGERVCIVNGKGLSAFAYVTDITKLNYKIKIMNFVEKLGEIEQKIDLALGILGNKERFEFAFEKAVEFRVSEFFPLITKFTQKESIDLERLVRKGISAIKQTFRSVIPKINSPIKLPQLMKKFKEYDKVLVFDREGNNFQTINEFHSLLIVIGPEGGFSPTELRTFSKKKNVEILRICDYPLRSETAAISVLSILSHQLLKV
ncbi:MAG: 16S rRNA (uracil(1498)-N(3))-methyltransferase [Ignavibacteria bacterium]|nr:16S rRNA (uracil(1498)-N(3))-methyltransferase [Ignavibacteria bacterium]